MHGCVHQPLTQSYVSWRNVRPWLRLGDGICPIPVSSSMKQAVTPIWSVEYASRRRNILPWYLCFGPRTQPSIVWRTVRTWSCVGLRFTKRIMKEEQQRSQCQFWGTPCIIRLILLSLLLKLTLASLLWRNRRSISPWWQECRCPGEFGWACVAKLCRMLG